MSFPLLRNYLSRLCDTLFVTLLHDRSSGRAHLTEAVLNSLLFCNARAIVWTLNRDTIDTNELDAFHNATSFVEPNIIDLGSQQW